MYNLMSCAGVRSYARVCVPNVLPHHSVLYCLYPAASEHHGLFVVSHCFEASLFSFGAEDSKSLSHPPNEPDEEQSSTAMAGRARFPPMSHF